MGCPPRSCQQRVETPEKMHALEDYIAFPFGSFWGVFGLFSGGRTVKLPGYVTKCLINHRVAFGGPSPRSDFNTFLRNVGDAVAGPGDTVIL